MLIHHVAKPYKTNQILSFLEPKSQKEPKIIEKALAREGFRDAFSKRRKTFKNQCEITIFTNREIDSENLIKPIVI